MKKQNLQMLSETMLRQLKRRGFYPLSEKEILLRLGEEIGEVFEAVREKQSKQNIARECADVLWILLIFCEKKDINLTGAFQEKLAYNEKRSDRYGIKKS